MQLISVGSHCGCYYEEPWRVIAPIMTAVPDVSLRLSPLCSALQLDRDEFYANRAMALYARPKPSNE